MILKCNMYLQVKGRQSVYTLDVLNSLLTKLTSCGYPFLKLVDKILGIIGRYLLLFLTFCSNFACFALSLSLYFWVCCYSLSLYEKGLLSSLLHDKHLSSFQYWVECALSVSSVRVFIPKSLNSPCRSSIRQRRNPKETADLSSIQELVDEINSKCHSGELFTKLNWLIDC